jgi:hypothetical protein
MRKTEYTLDATRVPNNAELVLAALRAGLRFPDEIADHAGLTAAQTRLALEQLSRDDQAEYRFGLRSERGWFAIADAPLDAVFVSGEPHSPWAAFGYPAGAIIPLVGRVHRMAG